MMVISDVQAFCAVLGFRCSNTNISVFVDRCHGRCRFCPICFAVLLDTLTVLVFPKVMPKWLLTESIYPEKAQTSARKQKLAASENVFGREAIGILSLNAAMLARVNFIAKPALPQQ
jgi:hypothetical protein